MNFKKVPALFADDPEEDETDRAIISQLPTWKEAKGFDSKDEEEDENRYQEMMIPMHNYEEEVYSEEEDSLLNGALEDIHLQTNNCTYWKEVDSSKQFPRLMAKNAAKSERVKRVKGSAIIPTSPERMLAWVYAFTSNYDQRLHVVSNGRDFDAYPNKVITHINNHHHIVYYCMKVPFPLNSRSFLCRGIWKRTDEDQYILIYKPCTTSEPDVPDFKPSTKKNVIASDYEATWVIRRLRPYNFCHCTYMVRADIKGNVPAVILNHSATGALEKLKRAHTYFSKHNTVDYDEKALRDEMKEEDMEFNDDYGLGREDGQGDCMKISVSTRLDNFGTTDTDRADTAREEDD